MGAVLLAGGPRGRPLCATPTAPGGPMTDEELSAIEARANAATAGPWSTCFPGDPVAVVAEIDRKDYPDLIPVLVKPDLDEEASGLVKWVEDIIFAAHARSDVPALVA